MQATFGKGQQRKRPKLASFELSELLSTAESRGAEYSEEADTNISREVNASVGESCRGGGQERRGKVGVSCKSRRSEVKQRRGDGGEGSMATISPIDERMRTRNDSYLSGSSDPGGREELNNLEPR